MIARITSSSRSENSRPQTATFDDFAAAVICAFLEPTGSTALHHRRDGNDRSALCSLPAQSHDAGGRQQAGGARCSALTPGEVEQLMTEALPVAPSSTTTERVIRDVGASSKTGTKSSRAPYVEPSGTSRRTAVARDTPRSSRWRSRSEAGASSLRPRTSSPTDWTAAACGRPPRADSASSGCADSPRTVVGTRPGSAASIDVRRDLPEVDPTRGATR